MRPGLLAAWLAGLLLSIAAGWLIWRQAQIADPDLRFAATLAPLALWSLVPVVFWRFFAGDGGRSGTPGLRDQRRAVLALLADRGLSGRRARYSVPFYLVTGAPRCRQVEPARPLGPPALLTDNDRRRALVDRRGSGVRRDLLRPS
ncbi:hypothetical protein [Mesorhizobium sp. L-8-3]|uniref:hypothetical protein n=1 Tax=Mesorhizobium sp. L-8-3 TaxID=2744522 RepID=UPI00192820F5|nr:hypothetical protein [Mesorhizobium sp. L-8-3]BCH27608.1 hypothetical protein MesoLjLb_73930 [Mesorhizobium sp. L-8-3]